MNTTLQPAKRVIEYFQTRWPAGFDANAIITKVQELSQGVPVTAQFSNIGEAGIDPSKVTYAKLATDKTTKQALGIIVFQLPNTDDLAGSEDGVAYMSSAIETALLRRVTVPFGSFLGRDKAEGFLIPVSVDDFISESEAGTGSGARRFARAIWREYGKSLCDLLRTQAKLTLTVDELEKVLSNEAYAKQVYPKVPQSLWADKLIPVLQAKAPFNFKVKNRETGVEQDRVDDGGLFAHWLETRSTASFANDFDIEALDFGA